MPSAPRRSRLPLLVLAIAAVVLSGCRLDLVASVDVTASGGGRIALDVVFDVALLDELDALGVDPTADLETAATTAGWTLSRTAGERGSLIVTVERDVSSVADIGDQFRQLTAGLSEGDPALLIDIEVAVADDGASTVAGEAGFRPPATVGATLDGEPIGPDATQLAALTADTVVPVLRVTLPGAIVASDADQVDGSTLTWELPTDGLREVSATATAPAWWEQLSLTLLGAVAAGALVVLGVVAVLERRRRTPAAGGDVSSPGG